MCGLAGIIGEDNPSVVGRMLDVMHHRGPDDRDMCRIDTAGRLGPVVLGHVRLSIIDLSAAGRQPMRNDDGSIWIVFNGEIYNYLEVRADLARTGRRFVTRTDTEVILRAYEEWGPQCVQRLNGMFAFVIVDVGRSTTLLVRDRLGIKPLYYARVGSALVCASELKGLLQHPEIGRALDCESLDRYLTLGYVPGERTLFKGIYKLQPGTMLEVDGDGRSEVTEYWSIPPHEATQVAHEELRATARDLLTDAVRLQLISDVPLGAFLSGGLDSSTVVAIMAKELRLPDLNTFCVGFEGDHSRHDERRHAAELARHLGTNHHESVCTIDEAIDGLPAIAWHMDEPSSEDIVVPYLNVCRAARQRVTVVLTGEGSDEFFYGYRYYALERVRRRLGGLARPLKGPVMAALERMMGPSDLKARAAGYCLESNEVDAFLRWSSIIPADGTHELYGDALASHRTEGGLREWFLDAAHGRTESGVDLVAWFEARYRLVDHLLVRTDRLSMAVGLEARVPFLDHRIVEFLSRVPVSAKIRGVTGKRLLRDAFSDVLPQQTSQRRKKPFATPLGGWIERAAARYLTDSQLVADGLLRAPAIERILASRTMDPRRFENQAWSLIALEAWYRAFFTNGSGRPSASSALLGTSAPAMAEN